LITVVDPWVEPGDPTAEGYEVLAEIPAGQRYAAVVAAVAHQEFQGWPAAQWQGMIECNGVLLDLKDVMPRELEALRL
jgi:UDP-N-acetyl-D-galactosamine dehydrogenase